MNHIPHVGNLEEINTCQTSSSAAISQESASPMHSLWLQHHFSRLADADGKDGAA